MCWTGNRNDKRIAREDIRCKKIIGMGENKTLCAWFRTYHKYSIGDTYKTKLNVTDSKVAESGILITNGLHCYDNNVIITRVNDDEDSYLTVKRLRRGLIEYYHPFYKYVFLLAKVRPVIVECIIPKGTVYYENEWGEIVSETLKITRIIKPD